ncbi:MAG: acetyl/propionyl/methylcrotonyl-CoA carboxylase subunit alpha [Alphaproteobacteria bacterium]|nr:acetyl/propionyl/methylcrotonyl-CoA carboxylase subunit alpha [Alphaproteobacteria bacterium]
MFRSVLIANRGEIARRVMRTARAMGIRTVAVYSDADEGAAHVAEADVAVRIGEAEPRLSYLNASAIIAAAKLTGAEAVHPGYGFLSENADFAEACDAAGLIFIGPPAGAIRAMGLKDAAKALMVKAGVPVVPGYHGDDQTQARLREEAATVGYPLLIKAVAGGGGKGMRRVEGEADFDKALEGAKREAQSAFGDARVLIEKYVSRPRHIEIQVFADAHGNAVSLFERDCSLQRRHQKVIEEAPAPGMTDEMRAIMGEAAVKCALAIGYRGAGTVEFIADTSAGLSPERFYFMEMNTRLQVEHPVTEMITGLDLVQWQFRVAAGEQLPRDAGALGIRGHAIEARLYAEDPAKNFLPSIGRLLRLRLPEEGPHLRVDAGVRQGDAVTMFYDPMIAKVIAWDETRAGALRRLSQALSATEVAGLRSNAGFLVECLRHPAFAKGDIDTGFIERHLVEIVPKAEGLSTRVLAIACLHELLRQQAQALALAETRREPGGPWSLLDGFRIGRLGHGALHFAGEAGRITIAVTYERGGYRLAVPGGSVVVSGALEGDGQITAVIDGVRHSAGVVALPGSLLITLEGQTLSVPLVDPLAAGGGEEFTGAAILAPMPGRITAVSVKPGDRVRRGQALVSLEAMKMEHTLTAPGEREVAEVRVAPGDQVAEGTVTVLFKTAG